MNPSALGVLHFWDSLTWGMDQNWAPSEDGLQHSWLVQNKLWIHDQWNSENWIDRINTSGAWYCFIMKLKEQNSSFKTIANSEGSSIHVGIGDDRRLYRPSHPKAVAPNVLLFIALPLGHLGSNPFAHQFKYPRETVKFMSDSPQSWWSHRMVVDQMLG